MNAKEATVKREERLEVLLKEAESSPAIIAVRAEQAAAILTTRTDAARKIAVLRNEESLTIPKLEADRAEKEKSYLAAKAAMQAASDEFQAAHAALSMERSRVSGKIGRLEQILIENADPAIDEAILFFREKLSWLRTPGRISIDRRGAERNIFTEKITTKVESNYDAINAALQFCMAALREFERMKLSPELDLAKIEEMKKGIPKIDVFTESTGEKSMEKVPPILIPRFGGAASDEYEQTLIDRVIKKANDFLSKPATPRPAKKRAEPGERWIETRYTGARK